ncbi:MAG: hypothetical protein ACI3Y2_07700, partial [Candidatus Egerieousia sp.]
SLTMSHVCSYVKVHVKNTLSEGIKISEVKVTMDGKDIIGSFVPQFTDPTNCVLTKYNTFASSTATLSVVDGEEIATNGEADFYLGIAPQDLVAGDKMSVAVTATYVASENSATQTKDLTMTGAVDFKAGHIKTLNFAFDKEYDPAVTTTTIWSETFGTFGGASTTFTSNKLLSEYDYSGRNGYGVNHKGVPANASDADKLGVYFTTSNNNVRATTSSGANCTDGHLWFNKSQDCELTTSDIKLYGAKKLTFSFSQGTSGSQVVVSYKKSTDSDFTTLLTTNGPNAKYETVIDVPAGTESIIIKLAHVSSNAKNTRVDNLLLTTDDPVDAAE